MQLSFQIKLGMNKFNLIFSFFNLKSSGLLFPVNSNNYPNFGSKVIDEDIFCGNCKKII
jgi:hypothetical protein